MIASLLLVITLGHAKATYPMIGEPAPKLAIEKWVQGPKVTKFEKGKVYIIDIWAPWCGPCVGGMPHLSELQKQYARSGLVVIGLASDDEYGSSLESVQNLVKEKQKDINYSIAWDSQGKTYKTWMQVEADEGWPWSFIIDRQGRVAYIGHPEHIDDALKSILSGKYDLAKAREDYTKHLKDRHHVKDGG